MLRPAPALLVSLCACALAGCSTSRAIVGSVGGGECHVAHTPEYAVRGKTDYDQAWVNKTTEALVDGCKQPRPKARPAALDAPKAKAKKAAAKPPAKRGWRFWRRAPTS